MQPEPVLLGALADLTAALDDPDLDLVAALGVLADRIRATVDSYLGLTVDTDGAGSFTTLPPDGAVDAQTCLTLTLPGPVQDAPTVVLTLFASRPGAFVDLAADVSWLAAPHGASVALDQRLGAVRPDRAETLRAVSTINQAVGVLLDRGLLPDDAHRELDATAERSGTDRLGAAEQLLGSLDAGDRGPD